jgi:hypothetical protein
MQRVRLLNLSMCTLKIDFLYDFSERALLEELQRLAHNLGTDTPPATSINMAR